MQGVVAKVEEGVAGKPAAAKSACAHPAKKHISLDAAAINKAHARMVQPSCWQEVISNWCRLRQLCGWTSVVQEWKYM